MNSLIKKRVIKEANDYAKKLDDDAKNKVNDEVEKINKRCDLEVKSITDRSISSSDLKKKQMILSMKQQIVVETIKKANERLVNLPDSEYIEYIKKIFSKNVPTSDCKIMFKQL